MRRAPALLLAAVLAARDGGANPGTPQVGDILLAEQQLGAVLNVDPATGNRERREKKLRNGYVRGNRKEKLRSRHVR